MKKKFLLILTVSMGLMVSACSPQTAQTAEEVIETEEIEKNETSDKTALQLNEPVNYEDWEFTLTNVEFADELYTEPGDESPDDNFLLPVTDNESNYGTEEIKADDEHILLTYTFTYKYTGKTVLEDNQTTGAPYVYFGNDYMFSGVAQDGIKSSEYMAVIKLQEPLIWNLLSFANDDIATIYNFNIQKKKPDYVYEPFDETIHEVRGYIKLPIEVYDNIDEALSICFQLPNKVTDKYVIR